MNAAQVLQSFWEGFDLPAYDENTVPEDATLPRITYEALFGDFNETVQMNASIWYRSTSWAEITAKTQEIKDFIGLGGKVLKTDSGALWITRGSVFAQRMTDPDDSIRRMVITINVDFIEE